MELESKIDNVGKFVVEGFPLKVRVVYISHEFARLGFEADPAIFKMAKKNIEQLELDNINLINGALWNKEEDLEFLSSGADGGRVAADADTIRIKGYKLSAFLNRKVDFLKLDIEGAEVDVITEAQSKLSLVDRVFIEYHSFVKHPQSLDKLLSVLSNEGFRYYLSSPGLHSPNPFLKVNTYMDMDGQLNIYAQKDSS